MAIPAMLAAVALTASAACSGGSGSKGSAGAGAGVTVATEPPRTTTTNPYAVPAVIDVAYVNRVLAGLDAIMGDVTRTIIRTKTITTDAYDQMRAVYDSNDFLQLTVQGFEEDAREQFRSYKPSPGNTLTRVSRILTANSGCIFAQVQRDYSSVGVNPAAETSLRWIGLTPLNRGRDPKGYNKTAWALTYDGVPPNRSQPPNPCAA